MFKQIVLLCIFISILSGCANKNAESHKLLKTLASQGNIAEAIKLVKSEDFYPEENSKLLKVLELATLQYVHGDYLDSLKNFDLAKDISDKLFTESISKKISAALSNNTSDNYYGEKYERSLIRFYQAILHYKLYDIGKYRVIEKVTSIDPKTKKESVTEKLVEKEFSKKEKQQHLYAARATILEWDTLLTNYKSQYGGISSYKVDLMGKIFGAFIHERIGTRTDRNIAKQLYKDAKQILFRNYNLYPTFNGKYKSFAEDYEKLPKLKKAKIKKDYIIQTEYSKELVIFINDRLKDLKKNKNKKDNIKIILQDGFISEKKAKKIHIPLPVAHFGPIRGGNSDILSFTFELLAISYGSQPSISYELPYVENKQQSKQYFAVIKDQNKKEILRQKLIIVDPLSDIAFQTLDNKISSTYTKIGARIALKHIAAILSAYQLYRMQPNALGKLTAGLAYAATNKGIAASEQADTRCWSMLPHNIRMASFRLKPGQTYDLVIETHRGKTVLIGNVRKLVVSKNTVSTIDLNLL